MGALEQIAKAVLYEGYVLWPYRRSSIKNQQRWTFGGVYPPAYAAASGGADRSRVRTECLVQAASCAQVIVSVRFLQVVRRQMMACQQGSDVAVSELAVEDTRYLSWDEATERTIGVTIAVTPGPTSIEAPITVDGSADRESLLEAGNEIGAVIRSWESLRGTLSVTLTPIAHDSHDSLYRVAVTVRNDSTLSGGPREEAVRHTFNSAHVVLNADGAEFISQFSPDADLEAASAANRNEGLYPILVGDDGRRDTMLASPIILYDYPRIAPESPGDLFDGGEIDQLLILNVLTLTEDEQREMSDSDPRAREILERCTGLSEDDLMRLHGTVRTSQPAGGGGWAVS